MHDDIAFESDGLRLAGSFRPPADLPAGERRPAIIIMHGFGGHRDGPQQRWSSARFTEWGYVTMRFDFRGCGESEGPRGRVIPSEQVADALAAVAYMASRPEVDGARIALSGTSYGAIVAICAAAADPAIAAVIAQGGWGSGVNFFRNLHPGEAAWDKFTGMIAQDRRHREAGGAPAMAHRYDIVPVPEHLRANIDRRSIFEFPVETAEATMAFDPEELVGKIAPRPLLLIHSALDAVVPASGSIELFARAGQPTDMHLFSGVDHFMFGEDDPRVANLVGGWLARYLPVGGGAAGG